ncbi:MAG: hypothetical protein EHM18_03835 [Acidobacteria bacterium]|nr:MAG: hypothetical protein EHM18_03835 [Acidobacteriota bacterium]
MIKKLLLLAVWFSAPVYAQFNEIHWVTDSVLGFPHVVHGSVGSAYVETTLVLSNPGTTSVTVRFATGGITLPFAIPVSLGPGQTRLLEISGEPFEKGWLQLAATSPIGASVYFCIKPSRSSTEILSRVIVLGQPVTSKAVIPVFRDTQFAENTAVAVAAHRGLPYFSLRFSLFNEEGELVSTAESRDYQQSKYLDEIFEELPPSFRSGSLIVEYPPDVAMAFSAIGLYVHGDSLVSASSTAIETVGLYTVELKESVDETKQAQALAEQYGFALYGTTSGPYFGASMTREVARAVARDSHVEEVTLMAFGVISGE